MLLYVYMPLAPAVVWAVREFIRQRDAVASLAKLKEQIESAFDDAIAGKKSVTEVSQFSRNTQDMIFDGRSRNPLFFNFIHRRFRPDHELRMNEKAKEMVEAALEKWEH